MCGWLLKIRVETGRESNALFVVSQFGFHKTEVMDATDEHRKTSTFAILPDTPGDGILVKTIFAGLGRGRNTQDYNQQQQLYSE